MKNKFFAYICAFALVLSLLVIPSFALENDFTGNYEFAYEIDFSPLKIDGVLFDLRVMFTCQDVSYDMISFVHNAHTGNITMNYWTEDTSTLVYSASSGWVNDEYRFIYIEGYDNQSPYLIEFLSFLNANAYVPEPNYNGWFYDIYDTLHIAVFDGNDLTGAQDMVLTLLSVVFCCVAIALPVIVVLFFVKYVLSMRFY